MRPSDETQTKQPFTTKRQLGLLLLPMILFAFAGGRMPSAGGAMAVLLLVALSLYLILSRQRQVQRRQEGTYRKIVRWIGNIAGYLIWWVMVASFNGLF
ncbi:hypothetical protein AUJ46_05260 [Candidatus Peregrinibacteria bacterium CG1_02_54_53]|nr:MAG: hypothetical protein AUJ46_05260 [Candidatus Peregrinibacteria bacterium CG1_02_54_53]